MGLSQKKLAEMLGVQRANIWGWENGKWRPGIEVAERLLACLTVEDSNDQVSDYVN